MKNFRMQILATILSIGLFVVLGLGVVIYSLMVAAGTPPSFGSQPEIVSEVPQGEAVAAAPTEPETPAPVVDLNATIAAINRGGCTACHTIPGIPNAIGVVGPNLATIGVDAATRRDGYSAADYIHESIAEPNAFTAKDCPFGPCVAGTMPVVQLNNDEITAIVNYFVTLDGSQSAAAAAETTQDTAAPSDVAGFIASALEPIAEPVAPPDVVASFNKGGCSACHTIPGVPGANGQVGPDLSNIGDVADTRVAGLATDAYIRQSILEPNAIIAPECPSGVCPANVMLQTFAKSLSDQDLNTIVEYLSNLGTDQAVELVAASFEQEAIEVSLPPESILDPFMPLPSEPANEAQITLGKYLFFDSRLSNNNSLSCASCHQPDNAYTDGQALSRGYPSTQYFRNVPTLYNTAYKDYLYHDGRMDGSDMPTLVRDHLTEAHFMSNDGRLMAERLKQVPAYVDLFNEAYGSGPGFGSTLRAVTAYVQSLNSSATPYDQHLAGDTNALSADARAGLALFEGKADCVRCHNGPLLGESDFHNIGIPTDEAMFEDPELHVTFRRFFRIFGVPNYRNLREDVGLYALTFDEADWGKFLTPGLREVGRTAPYMHNGSLDTLEDVVRFYSEGGGSTQSANLKPLRLTDNEIDQLVAFLESLSSEPIPVEAPNLPDYQLMTLGGTQ